MNEELKLICLSQKHGYDVRKNLTVVSDRLMLNDRILLTKSKYPKLIQLCFLNIRQDKLIIEARDNCWLPRDE